MKRVWLSLCPAIEGILTKTTMKQRQMNVANMSPSFSKWEPNTTNCRSSMSMLPTPVVREEPEQDLNMKKRTTASIQAGCISQQENLFRRMTLSYNWFNSVRTTLSQQYVFPDIEAGSVLKKRKKKMNKHKLKRRRKKDRLKTK